MVEEMTASSMLRGSVSLAQFYNLWTEYYRHVSIPTVSKAYRIASYLFKLGTKNLINDFLLNTGE